MPVWLPVLKEDLMIIMISVILLYARCLKYRLVMTSMICMTLEMTGLTSMHHAPSFSALTSVVHLPSSKIISCNTLLAGNFTNVIFRFALGLRDNHPEFCVPI